MRARTERRRGLGRVAALAALLALSACERSCKGDHPYVPYTIGDGAAAVGVVGDGGAAVVVTPSADAGDELVVPPGTARLALGKGTISAPEGRVFARVLVRDLDGDGAPDAVAFVRAVQGAPETDSLVLFRGARLEAPEVLLAGGEALPDPSCSPTERLQVAGARSIVAEASVVCAGHHAFSLPRSLTVVSADRAGLRKKVAARVLDPPGAPRLALTVTAPDRDGDGIDDLVVKVSLEPATPRSLALTVSFLDRPAGLSRDADEPEASIRAIAEIVAARAGKPKEGPSVTPTVGELHALVRAVCEDGGGPRLVVEGASIRCGGSRALEDAEVAEVKALAAYGDPLRAAAALARLGRPPAARTPKKIAEAEQLLALAAPEQRAAVRSVGAVPEVPSGPAWSPLAFDASGKLLVLGKQGVVRVDPQTGEESEAPDVSPWKLPIVSPDGQSRLLEVYDACDGVALRGTFAPLGAGDARDVVLPVAPPLAARCSRKGEPMPVTPVAWGPRGLELVAAGEPVLVPTGVAAGEAGPRLVAGPYQLGAPRSPQGKLLALATSRGVIVRGDKARTFRPRELEGRYAELSACVPSDDGQRVACLKGGRVVVLTASE